RDPEGAAAVLHDGGADVLPAARPGGLLQPRDRPDPPAAPLPAAGAPPGRPGRSAQGVSRPNPRHGRKDSHALGRSDPLAADVAGAAGAGVGGGLGAVAVPPPRPAPPLAGRPPGRPRRPGGGPAAVLLPPGADAAGVASPGPAPAGGADAVPPR